jgi:hypothetical protein
LLEQSSACRAISKAFFGNWSSSYVPLSGTPADKLVNWSTGQLVNWSTGQLVNWSTGQLVNAAKIVSVVGA